MGLNNQAFLTHIQKSYDQSILSIGSDNPPTEVITAAGFVTYTAPFENIKMVQNETGKSDFGRFE